MPFYPSPDRDDGYDLTDFYGVDPRLGNHGELVEVIRTAHDRGINVIADLVVNHTSDRHPWFQAARRSTVQPLPRLLRLAGHRAAGHLEAGRLPRPGGLDLGARRPHGGVVPPQLLQAPARPQPRQPRGGATRSCASSDSGCSSGFDGFRVDGIPFLEQNAENIGDPAPRRSTRTSCMRTIRGFLNRRAGARDDARRGQPAPRPAASSSSAGTPADELQMQFDFIGMQATYLALAREDAGPLVTALRGAAGHRPGPASGRRSCATTTSSRSTSSPTPSARRCSRRSGRSPRCRSTTAASSAGSRPCSAATRDGSGWPTA